MICKECMQGFIDEYKKHAENNNSGTFVNTDDFLLTQAQKVIQQRKQVGLEGLVGDLDFVIVNVEQDRVKDTVAEFIEYAGMRFENAFEDNNFIAAVLKMQKGADFLIRSRKSNTPWPSVQDCTKACHLPNTRVETFVYSTSDIKKYYEIQKLRGVKFMTDGVIETDNYFFIQTISSTYTNLSTGFIQWKVKQKKYDNRNTKKLDWEFAKSSNPLVNNIKYLDHAATRVEAAGRDAAIIEFMHLTNYNFQFSVYVKLFNSITNVSRLGEDDFAMVFTSGISPYVDDEASGPTEKFVHNYGKRVHHLAFHTENIDETFKSLKNDDMEFLVGLVGNEQEGLKQTFTKPSENTLLVNEYIHRYGDFDGFFTKSNVTKLTAATDNQ